MNYRWNLTDLENIPKNGLKVFSTFACGGGSSMGYKLAGYEVLGCNDIDPRMTEVYKANFNPKYVITAPIKDLLEMELPEELFNLDILDGSPPCSNFSLAGNREKDWGKEKKFREGQAMQVLDTLFFDYIALTKRLQPKVVIAENVEGMLLGNAMSYCQRVIKDFEAAGYYVEHWLLDASKMGVPQRRHRVFFIGIRKDLALLIPGNRQNLFTQMPILDLYFDERPLPFGEVRDKDGLEVKHTKHWELVQQRIPTDHCISDINERLYNKVSGFNHMIIHDNIVCNTIPSAGEFWRYCDGKQFTTNDLAVCQTFPVDYNYNGNNPKYLIGMSVPPLMVAKIAERIKTQWFDKLPKS